MRRALPSFAMLALCACFALACSRKSEATKPGEAKPAAIAADAPKPKPKPTADFSGVVRGIVKFAKGHELPVLAAPKEQVVNAAAPCPPYDPVVDRQVFTLVEETRGVSPVHIAITQMTAAPEHTPEVREVVIDGCRLGPKFLGAVSGDTLKITNRSDTPFLPSLPGDPYMTGINKGSSREVPLRRLGPTRVRCTLAGYCGESTVITLSHSLFAVTDDKGEFVIKNVPLDQDLMLHAAHPLFAVVSKPFKVTKDAPEATVEFEVVPRNPPAVPGDKTRDEAPKAGEKTAKKKSKGAEKTAPTVL